MARYVKLSDVQVGELEGLVKRNKSVSEVKRAQAVLMLNDGIGIGSIRLVTGLSERRIYSCRQQFISGGVQAIEEKRDQKTRELLSKKQRKEIIDTLMNKSPRDFDYESDFWTTNILTHLIKEKYNVKYKSKTSYYVLFRESKFSYHLPGRVYEGRDHNNVDTWKHRQETKIRQMMIIHT